jgi:hypothetical protein
LLQPHRIVAANALFEIGTATISAVLWLNKLLSQTNTCCVPKFCYQSVNFCLIPSFFIRMSIATCFTNSSRWFWCEACWTMNSCSAHEHTTFHLHILCAAGVSSGLATRATLTRMSRVRLE